MHRIHITTHNIFSRLWHRWYITYIFVDKLGHHCIRQWRVTIEVWKWISNIIPLFTRSVIGDPSWDLSQIMLVKSPSRSRDFARVEPLAPFQTQVSMKTLRPRKKGHHLADDIFKAIFHWKVYFDYFLGKVGPNGSINNNPAFVQIMIYTEQATDHCLNLWGHSKTYNVYVFVMT